MAFPVKHLTVGGGDPFLPQLLDSINYATEICIAAAFIRETGLNLIKDALIDALKRDTRVRIVTGDYLHITDPEALRQLMPLKELGAEVKVFESGNRQSFHMKAYLFIWDNGSDTVEGNIFVGSSNISRAALTTGLEWNLRIDKQEDKVRFDEIVVQYDRLFDDRRCKNLTYDWIDDYRSRRAKAAEKGQVPQIPEVYEVTDVATPSLIQHEALELLKQSRVDGVKRGLVVLATGLGKTWLAAFDCEAVNAKNVLFVAHREEILAQAESTFLKIRPKARVGWYNGETRDLDVNILFASIQTLGQDQHLKNFIDSHFDYIVVDEFHHAAARTYRKLLNYFKPGFMLGLTATPERTDQADILSLCDDNLVYSRDLVDGIDAGLLSPFDYYGISDVVDYSKVRRTGGKFDSEQLFDEFRTKQRASHNFKHWQKHSQTRTLAFCVSKRHADDMASYFCSKKVKAIAVYSGSATRRSDALKQLSEGEVDIIFSVDLFNEGVDLPAIDTVLMLRPSDSKIIFLQQLGRGLRISPATGKNKLVVLDFIGNHVSFFRKAEALFKVGATSTARRNFLKKAVKKALPLPDGCTVKYDLVAIGFLKRYCTTKLSTQEDIYQALKDSLDRRPTLVEFYYATGEFKPLRRAYGQWFKFVELAGDLSLPEIECLQEHGEFFRAMEITSLEKCFKLILLEAMQELSGFEVPPTKLKLALQSWQILQRRPVSRTDLSKEYLAGKELTVAQQPEWLKYWQTNPINAWVGKNLQSRNGFFDEQDELFFFKSKVTGTMLESFTVLLQELIDFRYAQYDDSKLTKSIKAAQVPTTVATNVADFPPREQISQSVPYFADLKIACGHFKLSEHDETAVKMMALPLSYGKLDPKKHFIACAKGHSMDGGKNPIKDGDYLLLEKVSPTSAGSMRNQIIAIELENTAGDDQYLLRKINKLGDGEYALIALNPDYESILTSGDMHPIGRFKRVVEFD